MSNDQNKHEDDENVIHFPELGKRDSLRKQKKNETKRAEQDIENARKEQERLEDEYRRQYRAEHSARNRLKSALNNGANDKYNNDNFINWDRIPPFTGGIIVCFVLVHIATSFLLDDIQRFSIVLHYGFTPGFYTGALPWSWSALIAPFTTLIMHGGWTHLIFNSIMMLAMGVFFERQFGARRTAIFFLLSGMAGNLAFFILSPAITAPVIGASGAISGLFGATFLMMQSSGMAGLEAQRRGPLPFILIWLCIIVGFGMISADTAWQSHLGGFLGGIGFFHLFRTGKIKL